MRSSFLIPIICWLPPGYDCTVVMPSEALAGVLVDGSGSLDRRWQVACSGEIIASGSDILVFENGVQIAGPEPGFHWACADAPIIQAAAGGFLEYAITSAQETPIFTRNWLPEQYNVYTGEGRKSFFMCHEWKFASPVVIQQIAQFNRYLDAYPIVHIDKARAFADSINLINPYSKAVIANIHTYDGRELKRLRIEPMSVRQVELKALLRDEETEWLGEIQITANNRVLTQIVKHQYSDPGVISTVEHLDPFRGEPTHFPWARAFRIRYGKWRERRRPA